MDPRHPTCAAASRPWVLYAEQESASAGATCTYLKENGLDVEWVQSGDAALRRARQSPPDLLMLNVLLPGVGGFEVCRQLRGMGLPLPILFLGPDDGIDRVAALELGADEYLDAPVPPRILLAHARALLRRTRLPQPALDGQKAIACGSLILDVPARSVDIDGNTVRLTSADFEVLWLLARHLGHPVSREVILETLRGLPYDGVNRSVDCRIYRLRQKLRAAGDALDRIRTVRGSGYLLTVA